VNHVSNVSDPQIPAALAPVVAGISPLNDFHPRAMHTAPRGRTATPAPTSANPKAMSIQPSGNRPDLTFTDSQGNNFYGIVPADFATIYNTPVGALNANFSGNTGYTGTGVKIGIAGDSNVDVNNVTNYRNRFGLTPSPTPQVVVDGKDPGTGSDDEVEALLDLEIASAVAPNAIPVLYTAQNTTFQSGLFLAIQRALDDNQVSILNVSFGGCEAYQGQSGNAEILNFWEQAAAQGISVTVSTGDSGSAGCDDPNTETSATQGLQVNGIGSTPFNIAVGGTDFNQTPANESQYWNSINNSSNSGSAKGPIPEIPWNDSTTTIGSFTGNVPFKDSQTNTDITGAGGGVSGCLNATVDQNGKVTACSSTNGAYSKPSWQSSFGTLNARQIPDVSLFAADGLHSVAWVLCASNLGANPSGTDCTPNSQGSYSFQLVGGTSASSPAFAGVLALVIDQLQGGSGSGNVRLGQVDYILYPLSKQYPQTFHDVMTGNNSVYCLSGAPNCGANGFLIGYNASSGYDLATGLGSLDVTQLLQNWSKVTFKPTSTSLTVNGSTNPVTIQHGTAVSINVTVTSSGGTPTGDVALIASGGNNPTSAEAVQDSVASPSILALSNGTAANNSYPYLPGGTYNLSANYGGDGIFAASTSNPTVLMIVSPEASTLDLLVQDFDASTGHGAAITSVPYGTYISVAAQPLSTAQVNSNQQQTYTVQATGMVNFSSSAAQLNVNNVPVDSNGFAEIPGQIGLAYAPGTYTVSASYSGDASFKSSTAAAQTFTVTKAPTTLSESPDPNNPNIGVDVTPSFNHALFSAQNIQYPTGTVTIINSSGATVASSVVVQVTNSPYSGAVLPLDTTKLTAGTNTLSLSYAGDGNYSASGPSAFTYNFTPGGGGSFILSATPASVSISQGGSGKTSIRIMPASFTGSVNLSCAVTPAVALGPTCALAQASVSVSGSTTVNDTLTINTTTSSAAKRIANNASSDTWYAAGGVAFAGILLFGIPGRRRAWQRMIGLMLLFISIGVIGCGGGSSRGGGGGGTSAGTYTVTVTATSGSQSATTTVVATVQ
jgi:trimeric autotransporter adhesin